MGLSIIATALLFFIDYKSATVEGNDVLSSSNYFVVSKKITGINIYNRNDNTTEILNDLKNQPWVSNAAPFTNAHFNIMASVEFAGQTMSTALFFEAIPDVFFDTIPAGWQFIPDEENQVIPIIIPHDYLALYNFGFAASRGLPKIGEEIMESVPIKISISGNGLQRYFDARIAGFTSRINTIAVPLSFLDWANSIYGNSTPNSNLRIIVESSPNVSDKIIKNYLDVHNLERDGRENFSSEAFSLLKLTSTIFICIGSLISILAVALMIISIFLLLHKTKSVNYRLISIGYNPAFIGRSFTFIFAIVNIFLFTIISILVVFSQHFAKKLFLEAGLEVTASEIYVILIVMFILSLITMISYFVFRKSIKKISG